MKIFLPFKQEGNPYLEELTHHSRHNFVYDDYRNFDTSFNYVNIHWPEAIYNWEEPTESELEELELAILEWKKSSVLVYTKHDFQRNKGTTPNFTRLFNLVEEYTDIFIHLGEFSRYIYEKKYPDAKHEIVYHPILENAGDVNLKINAREKLGIDYDAKVITIPGRIRSFAERDMVLKSFNFLEIEKKVLICPNMRNEIRYDFKGRVRLKKIFDIQKYIKKKFKKKHQPPIYLFNYEPMDLNDLLMRTAAADVVLVPRRDILNSGIVFLGLGLKKVVVGPAIGNINEQLIEMGFPVFDPDSRSSVKNAMRNGLKLAESLVEYPEPMAKYHPEKIGVEYDEVLRKYKRYD